MKITTRVVLGFILVLLLFVFVTFMNVRISGQVEENLGWLGKTLQTLQTSAMSQRSLFQVQSSFRGYLITADPNYLSEHKTSRLKLEKQLDTLQSSANASLVQMQLLNKIDSSLVVYYGVLDVLINIRQDAAGGLRSGKRAYDTVIREHFITRTNQKLINEITVNFNNFDSIQLNQRKIRTTRLRESIDHSKNTSVILIGAAFLVSSVVVVVLYKFISNRIAQMVGLAENVAGGNVKSLIIDRNNDELSKVSVSLQHMANRIEAGIEELRKSNKELDQFAYVVSHDLKAPLRAIANLSEWIEEDLGNNVPEETKKHLNLMRGRVHRMENLINGILEYSRVGRINVKKEEFNVGDMLKDVIHLLAQPQHFTFNIQPEMPTLITEKLRLEQVFTNLIGNAIKYHHTNNGKINLFCEDEGAFYKFIVEDNGPGIAPEFHDKIFTIFQTLQARDKVESTGVGLAIVKKIIDEQGGKIHLESAIGKGSKFVFLWPKNSNTTIS